MDDPLVSDLKCKDENSDKEVLNDFIVTYQSLPELWDTSNAGYLSKRKRLEALNILRFIYARIKTNASIADVRRKINTLRSNYRKEKRKILLSESSECNPEEVYKPTSWVYYALKFLDKSGSQASEEFYYGKAIGTVDNLAVTQKLVPLEDDGIEYLDDSIHSVESPTTTIDMETEHPNAIATPLPSFSSPLKEGRKRKRECTRNESAKKTYEYVLQLSPDAKEISPEAIVWSKKLRTLDPEQKLHAEKAINDILYEAQLGSLNRYSVKINEIKNDVI
ncbi:hypothetical protein EVAR_96072_1 [Eumeta japonica]|uniref:MADF domain-containing protein n=1 Tax=Eumeta variegata TaxID=151549 RepID=A0A4C1W6X0_EUMVA|nr:hypothetical protein EVAR_96072_1 [Eumeta japonica]